jgi:N-methylhydantoinase A/oxoprolinase/acetone carboxylase beta subunit
MKVDLYLGKELYEKLREEAQKNKVSMSEMVRRILESYFKGEIHQSDNLNPVEREEEKPRLPTWHGERKRVQEMIRKGKIPKELREQEVKRWIERWKDLPLEDLLIEYRDAKFNIQCEAIERILRERGEDVSILCNYDREVG